MTTISLGQPIRPRTYHYRVASPGLHVVLNRYSADVCRDRKTNVIGIGLVLGHHAYCLRWGRAH